MGALGGLVVIGAVAAVLLLGGGADETAGSDDVAGPTPAASDGSTGAVDPRPSEDTATEQPTAEPAEEQPTAEPAEEQPTAEPAEEQNPGGSGTRPTDLATAAASEPEDPLLARFGTTERVAYEFPDAATGSLDIWTAAPDGADPARLTDDPALDWQPAWSPGHDRLVFASSRDFPAGSTETSLYIMDADGGNVRRLTTGSSDRDPDWSPDGERIVFHSVVPGRPVVDLFLIDADGGVPRLLGGTEGNDLRPVWSGDGTQVLFFSDVGGLPDVFILDVTDPDAEPVPLFADPDVEDLNPSAFADLIAYNIRDDRVLVLRGDVAVPLPPSVRDEALDNPDLAPGGGAIAAVREVGEDVRVVVFPLGGDDEVSEFPLGSLGPAW